MKRTEEEEEERKKAVFFVQEKGILISKWGQMRQEKRKEPTESDFF